MTIIAALAVILLSILVLYYTYKQYVQSSIEYPSSYSPASAEIIQPTNGPANTTRPFFPNAAISVFHRRSERQDDRKVPNNT
jgi:hypothetical protein